MKRSMMDAMLLAMAMEDAPTKDSFGKLMHGNFSEEEKLAVLKRVELQGGYEFLAFNLNDKMGE
ncbi:hypothetical protein [Paratractidigestivibacter sp.]|uniref:hypothetical protein n=1 Tax=Paratractidigestivibacter sp. TaxID=2847316 RepID=UPI002AC8DA64|nr:hypothetical protein [Paratractidigestivibacter sp.]